MRIALVALALLAGWVAAGSVPHADGRVSLLKHGLIELALDQLRSPGSFDVTVGSVEDGDDGLTSLLDVQVSDGSGIWLTVERLAFAWQPKRLLAGELAIPHLDVVGATVLRAPGADAEWPELEPQPPWQRHVLDWPRAPIALALDRIRLERIEIREGVLPQPIRFDAEGRLHDREDVQDLTLAVQRTDAVAGEIVLETRRDFAADTLRLALSAREAAGGLVAAVAGFPEGAPAYLTLSGDGPPDNWRLSFEAAVEDVFAAGGAATVDYAGALAVDTRFFLRPGPAMDRDLRALLGEEARLVAAVTGRAAGQFDIAAAELTADAATLRLSGTFATASGHNDLAVSLAATSGAAALINDVAFERLAFEGVLTGPRGALAATGSLAVEAVDIGRASAARVTAEADVVLAPEGGEFALAGNVAGLRAEGIEAAAIGDVTLRLEGAVRDRHLVIEAADLDSRLLAGEARGHYDTTTGAGEVTVSLEVQDLARLTETAGMALQGTLAAVAEIRLAAATVEADVTVETRQLQAGSLSAARAALAGQVSRAGQEWLVDLSGTGTDLFHDDLPRGLVTDANLAMRGSLQGSALRIAALELASPLLTASTRGRVDLADRRIELTYRLRAPELAGVAGAFDVNAAGTMEATGRAAGSFGNVRLAGAATITDGTFNGRPYGRARLTHEIRIGAVVAGPVGITIDEGWLGKSTLGANVRLDRDAYRLEDVRADVAGVVFESDGIVMARGSMLVEGSGTVASSDLGPLSPIAGVRVAGTGEGTFALQAHEGGQGLVSRLSFANIAVSDLRAGRAVIDVAVQDLTSWEGLEVRVSGTSGSVGAVRVDALHAEVAGGLSTMAFSVAADGVLGPHQLDLALAGRAAVGDGQVRVTLASGSAAIAGERIDLGRPVEVHVDRRADRVETGELELLLAGGGRIAGNVRTQSSGYAGQLTGARIPASLLGHLVDLPITSGSLDVAATFATHAPGAGAQIDVRARDLVLADVEAAQALAVDLTGRWDGERMDLRATIHGGFGEPVEAQLALPVRAETGGIPRLSEHEAIDGSLSWRGEMADLWAQLPPSPHAVEGDVDVQLRVAGTVDSPRLSGRAEMSRGRYDLVDAGLSLMDVRVQASMADSAVMELRSSASDGGEGRLEGSATLRWGLRPTMDAEVRVERAMLLQRDDITARVSGTGRLHGPWSDLTFQGAFEVDEAEIRLIDATPPDALELDGVRLAHATEDIEVPAASAVSLDVAVRADRAVFVRGRGLESEWALDLRATGDAAAPVLAGALRKVRGSLDLLGAPFELTRGEIVFDGAGSLDPAIAVSLERQAADVDGGIYVDGRLSQPDIRFGSRSGLAPDEVLPRLVFGVSQQSLSGAQALQLSLGVARLLGHGSGIQDRLREAVGVDMLRVSGTSADDAAVTVGQNLGDQVFVGAEQKIGSGQSTIVVEVEVMENVVVDSRMEAGEGTNMGVSWRHDY